MTARIEGGSRVVTPDGAGRVIAIDVHRRWDYPGRRERRTSVARVRLDNGADRTYAFSALDLEQEADDDRTDS